MEYSHLFISMRISHMKDHFISVDQAIYDNSNVGKYMHTETFKTSTKFYKNTFSSDV